MRRSPWAAAALLTALALLATSPSAAAQPVFPPAASAAAPAAAPAAPPEVPEALRSARATMRTFLTALTAAASTGAAADLDAAAACLDLSELTAPARAESGRDLAVKLKEVIDRIRFVLYDELPDAPVGPPYVFYRDSLTGHVIALAADATGAWRFTPDTVAAIEDLYRALESHAKVPGVAATPADLSPSLWLRSKMPEPLKRVGFLMEHWQWLALILLVLVGALLARLIRWLLFGPVDRWLAHRALVVPSELVIAALRPLGLIVMALTWVLGLRWVGLSPEVQSVFTVAVKFLAAFGVVAFAFRLIDLASHVFARRADATPGRFDDLLVPLIRKSAKVVFAAIGIVFIADVVGVTPASLLAGLGLGGLAVALAAQDTVKNLFGSLTVLLDRPFDVGDAVIIGNDTEGVIEEVGFRSTRIRTYENSLITLPNANLISAKVDNLGARTHRRFRAVLGLTYDTPPEKLRAFTEGVRELIRSHPLTRKDNFAVFVHALGPSSIDVLVLVHFQTGAFDVAAGAQHELLLDVVTLASRLGVSFAFPTQTVVLRRGGDAPSSAAYPLADASTLDRDHRVGREEAQAILAAARTAPAPTPEPPTD